LHAMEALYQLSYSPEIAKSTYRMLRRGNHS
jgi:hypothetical protein